MRIGIDFDNTIVSYDRLFHKVALEGGHVPLDCPPSKISVRDHLRKIAKEDTWTEMQGYVYGARMKEADIFTGVLDFMRWAGDTGVELFIISHKTRHPFIGPRYDLHQAALDWVRDSLCDESGPLVSPGQIYFELTKDAKLERISQTRCDYFIDDLPEILLASGFPVSTQRILFDPEGLNREAATIVPMPSWNDIQAYMEAQCQKAR
jgi:hypothetical protein